MKETFGNPLAFDGPIYSIKYSSLSLGLSELKIYLNIQINQIDDDLKKARDVKDIGHYSHGKTEITIADRDEIPYTLSDKTSI
jgi:predicted transport protein